MSRHVLLGNMSCLADAGNPNERYQLFLKTGRGPFRCLIESMMLFDQIVIPTNDFMPLSLMAGVLGERPLTRLLDEDIVKFARFRGSIAYIGNGGGVGVFQVSSGETKAPKYFSAPLDEATKGAIDAVNADLDKKSIARLAHQSTNEFSLDVEDLQKTTYGEIKKNPYLIRAKGLVDVRRLRGIAPDQVRLLSGVLKENQEDDIFQVLRVAQAYMEVKAAASSGCDDIYTSDQVTQLFQSALLTAANRVSPNESFVELRELSGLPDVAEVVLNEKDKFDALLDLRNSTVGIQFREWFQENLRTNPSSVAREYSDLLKQIPGIQSAPARSIRYLIQLGIAAYGTFQMSPVGGLAAGAAAGAIDSFLVDRIFRGTSPKVFLEKLQKLATGD